MHNNTKPYWFLAKRYGWGWGFPSTWQGWVVLILFVAVVLVLPFVIDPDDNSLIFLAALIGSVGILIGVCYAKGESPKWRWGNSRAKREKAEQAIDPDALPDTGPNHHG